MILLMQDCKYDQVLSIPSLPEGCCPYIPIIAGGIIGVFV